MTGGCVISTYSYNFLIDCRCRISEIVNDISDHVCKLLRTFEICSLFWGYLLTNQNRMCCNATLRLASVFLICNQNERTQNADYRGSFLSFFPIFLRMSSKPLSSKKNCSFCDFPGSLRLLRCGSSL